MLTLFLILAFIFIILIACVPTEKNSKDVAPKGPFLKSSSLASEFPLSR